MSLLSCVVNWESEPPESILDWVESNVYFSELQGQVPGYWSHARFPYSAGPLQAMEDEDCREVVLRWGTQLGKTTTLGAYVAWKADQSPSPVLILCPNQPMANENYDQKLNPVLLQCASIERRRPPVHRRNKETVDLGRMMVYYAWAGSSGTVSSRTVPCILVNEAGLIENRGRSEGDRIQMARDRAKAYSAWRRKVIIEGKCTIEGECKITEAYLATDQRTYHVPCPHCGQYQELILGEKEGPGLQFNSKDVVNHPVWYRCTNGCRIDEAVKTLMYRRGLWVRKGERIAKGQSEQTQYLKQELPDGYCVDGTPENPTDKAGFHLTSLYSGALTWSEFAEAFVNATRGGRATLKVVCAIVACSTFCGAYQSSHF